MTFEVVGEMFEGDSADICTEKFLLILNRHFIIVFRLWVDAELSFFLICDTIDQQFVETVHCYKCCKKEKIVFPT